MSSSLTGTTEQGVASEKSLLLRNWKLIPPVEGDKELPDLLLSLLTCVYYCISSPFTHPGLLFTFLGIFYFKFLTKVWHNVHPTCSPVWQVTHLSAAAKIYTVHVLRSVKWEHGNLRGDTSHKRMEKVNMSQRSPPPHFYSSSLWDNPPGQSSAIGLISINLTSFSSYSFLVVAVWPR